MSASLVGSEMCIRDSPRALETWAGLRPSDSPSPDVAPLTDGQIALLLGCLLYTSDAADDM
eukprot:6674027-Alexandrium_andersonii.AAC.1